MRELCDSDSKYDSFKNIDVVILPPCTEEELDWLEGKEQIHQDITADYSWVTTAVMYRTRMAEHNQKSSYVAKLYEVTKSEVEQMLDMLSHAEAYLRDRGKEGQYSLVEVHEYAFRQLRKFRPQLNNEPKKEVYDQLAYNIIDKPEGDRTYQAVADVANYFDPVVAALQTEFQLKPQASAGTKIRLLGGAKVAPATAVLGLLKEMSKREKVRETIREVIASEHEKRREKQKSNYLFAQVKKAKSALDDAVQAISADSSRQGIADFLDGIEKNVTKIRKWLLNGKAPN